MPRDVASRNAKDVCDQGKGVGETGLAVYLDFRDAILRDGAEAIRKKYGNLFQMYEKITGEDPYKTPMMIYPAIHYTMGGLWVDYNLMTTIPGLFAIGEANFSDHGANRLGASALMQGLADGYFILPYTIGGYLTTEPLSAVDTGHEEFVRTEALAVSKIEKMLAIEGKRTVDEFHRDLGKIMWNHVGIARTWEGLEKAVEKIPELREEFWKNVTITGTAGDFNQTLERALRLADFLELGELMARDALCREESCGCHFNEACQTEEGEAKRNDEESAYVAAWEYQGPDKEPVVHKEPLVFENVELATRSYK